VGVVLTPIVTKETLSLGELRGRTLAVDGNAELYQFLALIRLRDGQPLQDSKGRITSHLSGLFYRVTRLIAEHGVNLAFVFDGTPPPLKAREVAKRRAVPICVAPIALERSFWGPGPMIYILAVFMPPLALLLNGQIFSAMINFVLIVPCLLLGFAFPVLWLVPSGHAVIAIYMSREDRKHREIVDAIERHGPPPGWRG